MPDCGVPQRTMLETGVETLQLQQLVSIIRVSRTSYSCESALAICQ